MRTHLINLIRGGILLLPFTLFGQLHEPCPENRRDEKSVVASTDVEKNDCERIAKLADRERAIYFSLGETYQKIYLYALDPEERHRVVVLVHRGHDPHVAINSILRSEHRKQQRTERKRRRLSPASKAIVEQKKPYAVY